MPYISSKLLDKIARHSRPNKVSGESMAAVVRRKVILHMW
jgi:stage V sporulation protein SpoVS